MRGQTDVELQDMKNIQGGPQIKYETSGEKNFDCQMSVCDFSDVFKLLERNRIFLIIYFKIF